MKRPIPSGRCISPIGCPSSTTTWASSRSSTVDLEKYFQDFADKTSFVFDALFPHVDGAPPTPVAKNAQAFYEWGLENNYPPIGFYSAYPGLGVQDVRALLADRQRHSRHRVTQLVACSRTLISPAAASERRRHHGERSGEGRASPIAWSRRHGPRDRWRFGGAKSALDLADIQGFVLRGYRMPMVRHFLLAVGTPAEARRQLGRLVSGDESDAPQITTAEDWHVGSRPDRETIRRMPRVARPTIASTSVSRGPGWWRWRSRNASRRCPSSHLVRSSKGPRNGRSLVGDTGASSPENWIGGFGSGDDHVLVTLHAISPEAMTSYSDRLCAWFAEGRCLSRDLAPGRDGVDGDAGRPTGADRQGSLRVHRRDQHAHHPRRPGALSP